VIGIAAGHGIPAYHRAQGMKTGKLLKFHRPGGDVQAYVYRDGALAKASIYVLPPDARGTGQAAHTVSGLNEAVVEADVRAWVDAHYPKAR
jgi:hypothetical protein